MDSGEVCCPCKGDSGCTGVAVCSDRAATVGDGVTLAVSIAQIVNLAYGGFFDVSKTLAFSREVYLDQARANVACPLRSAISTNV